MNFFIDDFVWSFSRLNSYYTCPYMFKQQYIDEIKGVNNCFGQFGTFGHEIIEKFCKDELQIFELSDYYEKNFKNVVTERFPPNKYVNLAESYYNSGKQYFDSFEGFDDYKILAVEMKCEFTLNGQKITGFIDLLVENKDGEIEIIDHKSKSKFANKNELFEYLRQLYLYSIAVYEKYGKYPVILNFNMFKKNEWVSAKFDMDALNESKKWVADTIELIRHDSEFKANYDDFFCSFICGHRFNCRYSKKYIGDLK